MANMNKQSDILKEAVVFFPMEPTHYFRLPVLFLMFIIYLCRQIFTKKKTHERTRDQKGKRLIGSTGHQLQAFPLKPDAEKMCARHHFFSY